jgi:hypothetical protein
VIEEQLVDIATAAQTVAELEMEMAALGKLERQAKALRHSGHDTKWRELQSILDDPLMTDAAQERRPRPRSHSVLWARRSRRKIVHGSCTCADAQPT